MLSIALALSMVLPPAAATVLPDKLPPVDQCSKDATFAAFRARLEHAAQLKDRKALLVLLSPHVLVNFGGASGPAAFAQSWDLSPDASEFWNLLRTMLRMGCARDKGARIIPSLSIQLEPYFEEEIDLSSKRLAFPGARVSKEPAGHRNAFATLSWDFVDAVETRADMQTKVKLADGREGWIADDELYEPVGYRMVVEKLRGKWMITAFVAGD